mmetsp:Transcript_38670/g.44545  ORF Transcript_38670/g.44545 Transcript_38670/m.44545 type:complete len:149 (+) Transcript_38670:153-599(+)
MNGTISEEPTTKSTIMSLSNQAGNQNASSIIPVLQMVAGEFAKVETAKEQVEVSLDESKAEIIQLKDQIREQKEEIKTMNNEKQVSRNEQNELQDKMEQIQASLDTLHTELKKKRFCIMVIDMILKGERVQWSNHETRSIQRMQTCEM